VASAVRALEAQGVGGYIIDVRNCLGGLLKEALFTASIFQEEEDAGGVGAEGTRAGSRVAGSGLYRSPQQCRLATGCASFDEQGSLSVEGGRAGGGEVDGSFGRGGGGVGGGGKIVRSLTLLNIMDASGLVRAETLEDQRDLDR
jgi:hypothetical protein